MKQALHRNSTADKRLLFLVNTITEIVWEADIEGNVVYASDRWYEFIGREPGSDISSVWLRVIHEDDRDRCLQAWQQSLKTGDPYEVECRFEEASTGKYKWFLVRAMPYLGNDGAIECWYGTCANIEAGKENAELMLMNRAKDEFISIASHQLRTPATAVKQYLGMALEGYAGDLTHSQQALLSKAYDNNERQLRIVSDLLRVAQLELGNDRFEKRLVDIGKLVHAAVNGHMDTFKQRDQSLTFNGLQKSIQAWVDTDTLRMVLDNLLENASKYTPQGGRIEVGVDKKSDTVEIAVCDWGVGIAPEHEKRLFIKFSRINNELSTIVGGTGLGLYWVKKVMALHGGDVRYVPNTPKGSKFIVSVPHSEHEDSEEVRHE